MYEIVKMLFTIPRHYSRNISRHNRGEKSHKSIKSGKKRREKKTVYTESILHTSARFRTPRKWKILQ